MLEHGELLLVVPLIRLMRNGLNEDLPLQWFSRTYAERSRRLIFTRGKIQPTGEVFQGTGKIRIFRKNLKASQISRENFHFLFQKCC